MANICISAQARDLLLALLAAQRRALLKYEDGDPDPRGSHTLVSARALLTLAQRCRRCSHLRAHRCLRRQLGIARQLTPLIVCSGGRNTRAGGNGETNMAECGSLRASTQSVGDVTPFRGAYYGDWALGSLIPNTTGELPYLYREVYGSPIEWWNPLELESEVEAWLVRAAGNGTCADRLIGFVRGLGT